MVIKLKISGQFIDKPLYKQFEVEDEQDAVQLPDGNILKVNQLKGDALDQYIYQKFIKGSIYNGRILSMEISK